MDEHDGFKIIHTQDLVMDSSGKAGIPFDILRNEFGFIIDIRGSEVYIKRNEDIVKALEDEERKAGCLTSTDNFKVDSKILKKFYGFKEYYQDSLIFSSENRGIKRYDVIISATKDWYNVTIKGDYKISCDINDDKNVIPKLLRYYFPSKYEEIIKIIIEEDSYRSVMDQRDTLIRSFDQDTKEMVFSKKGNVL